MPLNVVLLTTLLLSTVSAVPNLPPSTGVKHAGSARREFGLPWKAKEPRGGGFVPSRLRALGTRTTSARAAPALAGGMRRRANMEQVYSGQLATYDSDRVSDGIGDGVDSYQMYWGSGSTADGWPEKARWVSFRNMFENNKSEMLRACGRQMVPQAENTSEEMAAIWDGIQRAAAASGVDHRFILAVILQESRGCVRVPTTHYGVRNPGLMQDHDGTASCNDGGSVRNPCPSSTIYDMIIEGTSGTPSGDGLAACMNKAGAVDVSAFYKAARIYNSGTVSTTGALQNGIATHCYASDIANRLTGWVSAPSRCTCDAQPGSCAIVMS